MSRIRADRIVDRQATGSPLFPNGAVITGVATATTFSGALSGNATSATSATTATTATNAQGLTGSPNISVGTITASGNVSIAGTLTYEDVTNIDSVGIITARKGIVVTTGISTFKGAHFDGGLLKEKANIVANRLSDVSGVHVDLENGMTHVYTTDEDAGGASLAVNLRVSSSIELMDRLALGETISVNIITKPNGAGYIDEFTVDGAAVTEEWNGGSAPASAASGGYDLTTVQITRIASTGTENTDLLVQCNNSNFA
jgi:hypothetical protein